MVTFNLFLLVFTKSRALKMTMILKWNILTCSFFSYIPRTLMYFTNAKWNKLNVYPPLHPWFWGTNLFGHEVQCLSGIRLDDLQQTWELEASFLWVHLQCFQHVLHHVNGQSHQVWKLALCSKRDKPNGWLMQDAPFFKSWRRPHKNNSDKNSFT